MELFYTPGVCSLSPHIVLREVGAEFDLTQVNLAEKTTDKGGDYKEVNPRGYVPALRVSTGDVITEGSAIIQYLADQFPESGLAPAAGTIERAKLHSALNFVAAEVHKSFAPLFDASSTDELKEAAQKKVVSRFDMAEDMFKDGREYLMGSKFSIVDAYLFTVSTWLQMVGIDINQWPNVSKFADRIRNRPSVQAAMKAEGLI
ncbi:glutathione transferase GstA [Ruegeria arenilitoris]|uniref:glutathione transferase GstA n=1 Tax=Ruegeria arenilitoris TaxID=1173585 RepID=UPI00147B36FF|nr:glutathione transferase GstA [Ruegeria arenilitoris]